MGDRASIRAAIERLVERAVPVVASCVRTKLIETTPVDTGNARAHWLQTVGIPAPASSGTSPTAAAAFSDIVRYRLEDGSMFVSNFVPYIRKLNRGHSAQAPAGYVEQATSAGIAQAAAEIR